jgi:hypothetical protein
MIDDLDRRLTGWIQSVLPKIPVSLLPAAATPSGKGIALLAVDLATDPVARGAKRPPLRLQVRYLVTSWAPEPEEAHRMIGELAFSAMDRGDLELEPGPVPLELWRTLGLPPRAAFLLKATVQKEREEKPVPRVKVPLVLKKSLLRPLQGRVLGPKDIPLTKARVELLELGLAAETDPDGRFTFHAVPQGNGPRQVRVTAKGMTVDVKVGDEPLIIRMNSLEV